MLNILLHRVERGDLHAPSTLNPQLLLAIYRSSTFNCPYPADYALSRRSLAKTEPQSPALHHMRVDLRRADVLVSE
jgi:hypothetical protein